jgi:hypothetical protein
VSHVRRGALPHTKCGSRTGRNIHYKKKEPVCALCRQAQNDYMREYRRRNKPPVTDTNAVLRGTIGRLEDTIEALLGYTECGCGEDEEGHYGKCVPCHIRDEGIYP